MGSPGLSKLDGVAGAAHATEHLWTTENPCAARAKDDDSSIASATDTLKGKAASLGKSCALGTMKVICLSDVDMHQAEPR